MRQSLAQRAVVATVITAALLSPGVAVAGEPDEIRILFPHSGPTEFTDSFGAARSGGRSHQGNDLMTDKMTPVVAVADGVVVEVRTEEHPLAGYSVVMDHGGGLSSHYLHLNNDTPGSDDGAATFEMTFASGLHVGQRVRAGEQIAWSGDSGNAEWTGPHTHFELRVNDSAINPYPYLVAAWERYRLEMRIESGAVPFR
jgi:murein DD-endopeptidase MepM/ murein hydrolase activator NlpD